MAKVAFQVKNNAGVIVAGPVNASAVAGGTTEVPVSLQMLNADPADGPFTVEMITDAGVSGSASNMVFQAVAEPC